MAGDINFGSPQILTTGDLIRRIEPITGSLASSWGMNENIFKELVDHVVKELSSRGVALVRFEKDRFMCGEAELDHKHPETWGAVILAQMAREALEKT